MGSAASSQGIGAFTQPGANTAQQGVFSFDPQMLGAMLQNRVTARPMAPAAQAPQPAYNEAANYVPRPQTVPVQSGQGSSKGALSNSPLTQILASRMGGR